MAIDCFMYLQNISRPVENYDGHLNVFTRRLSASFELSFVQSYVQIVSNVAG